LKDAATSHSASAVNAPTAFDASSIADAPLIAQAPKIADAPVPALQSGSAADPVKYSLADFYFGDSDDPFSPPAEFNVWRREMAQVRTLFEPVLASAPTPRGEMILQDGPQKIINLSSYNYLGLAKHPEVLQAAHAALEEYGLGACGSPVLSGMTDLHRQLEIKLSEFLKRDATLLFNSGFSGALGSISGLLRKGDVAILDNKSHYSLIDGATLAKAKIEFFEHNNPESLDAALKRSEGRRRLVCVEGIYSMDGDMADLPALIPVAESHSVGVMIDEAHSIFTLGKNGRGAVEHFDVENRIALQYGTFSKATAALGGFASGEYYSVEYLRCYARSYMFSCALPPVVVAALLKGIEIATRDNSLREILWSNTEYFRNGLHELGLNTGDSTTQVVPIILGDDRAMLYELGHETRAKGLFLVPVDYPSVPQDEVRFRASVTAAHTREDLDEALNIINDTIVRRLREKGKLAR
jgi:8-amino-7-oxononanoate synthase